MPDGAVIRYRPKSINMQDYSSDEMFQKKLLMFFPYYVLRYEKNLPSALPKDRKNLERLLQEFEGLRERLNEELDEEKLSGYYADLLDLTQLIIRHIVKSPRVKERMCDTMGGKVLELRSERDRREGREEGREEGALLLAFKLISNGILTEADAAQQLDMPQEEVTKKYKAWMKNSKLPVSDKEVF